MKTEFDDFFNLDSSSEIPTETIPQSEYIERARKTFREIVSTYYSNWVNRPIKEEEYNEELCDKCQGNCVIKVGENESECHPDHEAGVCYVREYDSENYAYEMEEMMQNSDIFLLADIEATKDESNALQSSPLQGVPSVSEKVNCICAKCGENTGNNAAHLCPEDKTVKAYKFVVDHKTAIYQACKLYNGSYTKIKHNPQVQELIEQARKEIGYSEHTWSGDIFSRLRNLYAEICVDNSAE